MHILAGMALLPTNIPMVVKLAIWSALALSLVMGLRQGTVREITLDADGSARILDRGGKSVTAMVDPATAVFGWLVVLHVLAERRRRVIVLFPDSLGREEHRRLRAWLKWQASVTAA